MADTLATVKHPIEACYGSITHCFSHDVDEAARGYRICFECQHTFATADDLLAEHNRVLAELNQAVNPQGDPMWEFTEPIPPETEAEYVLCCPFCIHDF
jgi:hypothetical protein